MKKFFLSFICLLIIIFSSSCSNKLSNTNNLDNSKDNTFFENPITDFQYEFSADSKSVYIKKYIGTSDFVIIPSTIEGASVISLKGEQKDGIILSGVFETCTVKTVVIPDSITSIGINAFSGCKELTEIVVSAQCEKNLDGAFQNCVKLESIDLSQTKISLIGISAFEGCAKLCSHSFPVILLFFDNCILFCNIPVDNNVLLW